MKNPRFLSAALAGLFLTALAACHSGPTPEHQAELAEKAVLASHDTLMARMDELYDLRQQLQKVNLPDTALTARRGRALLAADAAMMDWMHQYHRPADSVVVPRKLAYFAAQQRKIDSVAQLMTLSLDSARQLVPSAAASPQPSAQ
ncbi:hypothetical protein [Hymenobacter persicinus]|uniref:Viral A-type inclusion protein n=1 Tax=Hymenobacter persicinus TaxID=2025506 RepID=A0A4Q5LDJ2_9BACT|nr:hypothetical protein [Hymenobacter persicinus]RYU81251.1 hypothetical protein EWM57_06655 [Hymenobacter persicinus]